MKKIKLLYYTILKYREENIEYLLDNFDVVELNDPSQDSEEILRDIEVILAPLGYMLDKEKIDQAPNLKVIGSNTTGHPHINVEYAKSNGISVHTLKYEKEFLDTITPTAELTWGLIIALTRNITAGQQSVREGKWDRRPLGGRKMLSRMKIGIVGLGRLGYKVAQYALRFGMDVSYYDPYVTSGYPGLEKCGSLVDLVKDVDVVSVHVPHEKETENMFSKDVFSEFKSGSYFINTSRGELIDHDALLENLKSGHLAGSALDVFENEFKQGFQDNLTEHPLWKYANNNFNLLLTPHIGGSTEDAWYETERYTIDAVLGALEKPENGKDLPVDKDKAWAIIPARGGSKTIPLKNMVKLAGKHIIKYAFEAGKSSSSISRIVCSTDSEKIAGYCESNGIEVQRRPDKLARDHTSTVEVILYFLQKIMEDENILPEYLVLLEPTSPFVQASHIDACIEELKLDVTADSAQTVTKVSSNSHAYNQRYHDVNGSNFLYVAERRTCVNKQLKPEFFIHGNVRVMRVESVIRTKSLFGNKSIPIEIPRIYAMDVDGPDDLELAESILETGLIEI